MLDSIMVPAALRIDCGGSVAQLDLITRACNNRRVLANQQF